MCTMAKGSIISCQITYFPIGSRQYLEEIDEVLELIKNSGLDYNVDILSTTIKGEADKVFDLITNIHKEMSYKNCNYTMNVMVSNICGCGLE